MPFHYLGRDGNVECLCFMWKKNLPIILVILLTLLLVAAAIWVFNKKLEEIEMKTAR
jgi:hypothetical protein